MGSHKTMTGSSNRRACYAVQLAGEKTPNPILPFPKRLLCQNTNIRCYEQDKPFQVLFLLFIFPYYRCSQLQRPRLRGLDGKLFWQSLSSMNPESAWQLTSERQFLQAPKGGPVVGNVGRCPGQHSSSYVFH